MHKLRSCINCKKYRKCEAACAKVDSYASQDHVGLREMTIGVPVIVYQEDMTIPPEIKVTKKEREILTLMGVHGFSRGEVSEYLKMSRHSLRNHLMNLRAKIKA